MIPPLVLLKTIVFHPPEKTRDIEPSFAWVLTPLAQKGGEGIDPYFLSDSDRNAHLHGGNFYVRQKFGAITGNYFDLRASSQSGSILP